MFYDFHQSFLQKFFQDLLQGFFQKILRRFLQNFSSNSFIKSCKYNSRKCSSGYSRNSSCYSPASFSGIPLRIDSENYQDANSSIGFFKKSKSKDSDRNFSGVSFINSSNISFKIPKDSFRNSYGTPSQTFSGKIS